MVKHRQVLSKVAIMEDKEVEDFNVLMLGEVVNDLETNFFKHDSLNILGLEVYLQKFLWRVRFFNCLDNKNLNIKMW